MAMCIEVTMSGWRGCYVVFHVKPLDLSTCTNDYDLRSVH